MRNLQGNRLPHGRHHLRRRDERLETRTPVRATSDSPPSSTARPGTRRPRPPSRRPSRNGGGHYLVVFTLDETDYVCDYIRNGGNKEEFLDKFEGAYSPGFDPDQHLALRRRRQPDHHDEERDRGSAAPLRQAMVDRYGARERRADISAWPTRSAARRRNGRTRFPTCSARKDGPAPRRRRLQQQQHLAPRRNGRGRAAHLLHPNAEQAPLRPGNLPLRPAQATGSDQTENWLPAGNVVVGITAGASCPNNLLDDAVRRLFELRGINADEFIAATEPAGEPVAFTPAPRPHGAHPEPDEP